MCARTRVYARARVYMMCGWMSVMYAGLENNVVTIIVFSL